jgi:hypothetical protein
MQQQQEKQQQEDPAALFKPRPRVVDDRNIPADFVYTPPRRLTASSPTQRPDALDRSASESSRYRRTYHPEAYAGRQEDDNELLLATLLEASPSRGANGMITSMRELAGMNATKPSATPSDKTG